MRNRFFTVLLKILLPVLLIALGLIGFQYFVATKPVEKPRAVVERSWNVSSLTVEPGQIISRVRAFGELVSARKVDLRSLVGGEVVFVSPELMEGAKVSAGGILLEVDPFDYEAAVRERKAALLEAKSRLDELLASERADQVLLEQDLEILEVEKRSLKRAETLKKRGNISEKALDDARTALSRQQQQVDQRKAQLDIERARIGQQQAIVERQKIALERAERDLKNVRLLAPFNGYIQNVAVELGKKIDVKDLVATLIDDTRLEVKFQLSTEQYGRLISSAEGLNGRQVRIFWQVGAEKIAFQGQLERIGSSIQAASGGVEVFARLQTNENLSRVRIGAFVEVDLDGVTYTNAIRIPNHALFEGDTVYLIKQGRLQPVTVRVLEDEGSSLIIDASVLQTGDQLLTTRFAEVGPGIKVEVR
ncbi:efflux RND transporter periplasmic adaptor subunit [Sneathiella glossodoripedis]|uniref:efflux RND transporter periplasmic adaptor subunit n=1 Tax=Sneathiella glossodoripedis TaxID=418853 RepID=UPI0004713331|nr:efflux RND transporter periplasmic adaptor subunit [Sneathiella glossodoripedis]